MLSVCFMPSLCVWVWVKKAYMCVCEISCLWGRGCFSSEFLTFPAHIYVLMSHTNTHTHTGCSVASHRWFFNCRDKYADRHDNAAKIQLGSNLSSVWGSEYVLVFLSLCGHDHWVTMWGLSLSYGDKDRIPTRSINQWVKNWFKIGIHLVWC